MCFGMCEENKSGKHTFKLTSKTFLKADHFPINNEKNLIKERNL